MGPALRHGDRLRVEPTGDTLLAVGDVVVARRAERLVTHRLVALAEGLATTRGDGCAGDDPPIPVGAIVGRVVEVVRRGRSFPPPGRAGGLRRRLRGLVAGRRVGRVLLLALGSALAGCAFAHAEAKPSPAKCDCTEIDPSKIGDLAKLDQENLESQEKVATLEKTVADLQERLARLAREREAAAAQLAEEKAAASEKHASGRGAKSDKHAKAEKPPRPDEPVAVEKTHKPEAPTRERESIVAIAGKRVRVRLANELIFAPGGDRITRAGRRALKEVAAVLKTTPSHRIEVNGHTDSTPTGTIWEDNWQLSLERAHRVVMFMIAQGLEPRRFVASGYGDTDPVESGATPEAQARNRRVEIFIEPSSSAPSAAAR